MDRPSPRLLAAAAIGVAVLAGCNDDGARTAPSSVPATTAPAAADAAPVGWLFVVDAAGGSAADGTVTLRDVGQYAISFSERPERLVRRIAVADLVARWAELGFEADPPNVSLTFDEDGGEQVHTVTLSAPTVAGDDVTFSVTPLEGATPLVLGAPTAEVPADFGPAALFIDASGATVDDNPGGMSMAAVTEAEYEAAVAGAEKRSREACVTQEQTTLCTTIDATSTELKWSVVAEVPAPSGGFSSTMSFVNDDGTTYQASVPTTDLGSRWMMLTWDWPAIVPQEPAPAILEMTVELTVGDTTSGSGCVVGSPQYLPVCSPSE